MVSPSGALNENANESSQLSAGGAGRWCEVEKCGFIHAVQNWGPKTSLLFITCPGAKLSHFILGLIDVVWDPLSNGKNNWGKRTRLARVTSDLLILAPPNAPAPIDP